MYYSYQKNKRSADFRYKKKSGFKINLHVVSFHENLLISSHFNILILLKENNILQNLFRNTESGVRNVKQYW